MNLRKRILVVGATGAQGGSVARALLTTDDYIVRILTRNPQNATAMEFAAAGAEVAFGDLEDIDSLKLAMQDCYGVFGVTNFWEHFGREYQQGINLINAVYTSGIQHFVLHTLPDYYQLSGGQFPVPHCDIKAKLQRYCSQLGIPATFVQVAFYYENFLSFFPLRYGPDNKWHFGFPQGHTKLAMTSVEDVGPVVRAIFNNRQEYLGRTVGVVAEDSTCDEYAKIMSRVFGREVCYEYIPRELFMEMSAVESEEIANMFEVQRLFILNRQADKEESLQLNPAMQSFEGWLQKHVEAFETRFQQQEPMAYA